MEEARLRRWQVGLGLAARRYWAPRAWAGKRFSAGFLLDATNEGVAAYDLTPDVSREAPADSSVSHYRQRPGEDR